MRDSIAEFNKINIDLYTTKNLPDSYSIYVIEIESLNLSHIKNFVLDNLSSSFIFIGECTFSDLKNILNIPLKSKIDVFDGERDSTEIFTLNHDDDESFSAMYYHFDSYSPIIKTAILPHQQGDSLDYLIPALELYNDFLQTTSSRALDYKAGFISKIYTNSSTNTYYETQYAISRQIYGSSQSQYKLVSATYFNKNGYSLDLEHAGNVNANALLLNYSPESQNQGGLIFTLPIIGLQINLSSTKIVTSRPTNRAVKWSYLNLTATAWNDSKDLPGVSTISVDNSDNLIFYIRTKGVDKNSNASEYNIYSIFLSK